MGAAALRCPGKPRPHSRAQRTDREPEDQAGIQPRHFLPSYTSFLGTVSVSWAQRFRGRCQPSPLWRSCAGIRRRGKERVSARTFHLGSGKPAIFFKCGPSTPKCPALCQPPQTWSQSPGTICLEGRRLLLEGVFTASLAVGLGQMKKETSPRLPTHCTP